jgi:hypothetical protein
MAKQIRKLATNQTACMASVQASALFMAGTRLAHGGMCNHGLHDFVFSLAAAALQMPRPKWLAVTVNRALPHGADISLCVKQLHKPAHVAGQIVRGTGGNAGNNIAVRAQSWPKRRLHVRYTLSVSPLDEGQKGQADKQAGHGQRFAVHVMQPSTSLQFSARYQVPSFKPSAPSWPVAKPWHLPSSS